MTYKACLKSSIRYVELFFPIYWRFELTWVCCVVGYNCHTISSTAIIKFVFTRDYFENFGGPFLASSVINKSKNVLPHLSMKKRVKSLEACLVKRKSKTGEQKTTISKVSSTVSVLCNYFLHYVNIKIDYQKFVQDFNWLNQTLYNYNQRLKNKVSW